MKISVALNRKSIKDAVKQIDYVKKMIPVMFDEFIEAVALWIIERANQYVYASDIGENVKIDITGGWYYDRTPTGMKIKNTSDKAVFVEFGVGIVGQGQPHPQSSVEGYQYNIGSKIIFDDSSWIFNVSSDDEIDIQSKFIVNRGNTSVRTRGQPALMYAYNAIVDARNELRKKNGGEIGSLWEKEKKRYLG